MKPKVLFDTNIYIRKLITPRGGGDKLFALFLRKEIELYTSRYQLEEIAEVAQRLAPDKGIPEAEIVVVIGKLINRANLVSTRRQNKVSPDADDNWIIGIAIRAKADYLVTENPKDIHQDLMPNTSCPRSSRI